MKAFILYMFIIKLLALLRYLIIKLISINYSFASSNDYRFSTNFKSSKKLNYQVISHS